MGAPEHVGFADDAGRYCYGVDGGVEFCVSGREEGFFEEAAGLLEEGSRRGPIWLWLFEGVVL